MANTLSAKKRARQGEARRRRNASKRSMMRTHLKGVLKAIEDGDKTAAQAAFTNAQSTLDQMASNGIIHKNKAARHKARLNAQIKAMKEV